MGDDGQTVRGLSRIDPTKALAELPGATAGGAVRLIGRAWPEAAGVAVAAHTWPARVARDGTLVVHCSSATWVSELALMSGLVARRLQDALGEPEPRQIRFRLGPMPSRIDLAPAARAVPEPDARTRAQAARLAAPVADEALRAAVERAITGRLMRASGTAHEGPAQTPAAPENGAPSGTLMPRSEGWRHRR